MPELKYKNLFSPITIRGKTFKNRILVAPMGTEDEAAGGYISEACAYFYERVAKGGAARVCTVEAPINYGTANRNCLTFFDDVPSMGFRRNMSLFSDLCHRHGSLAFTSFTHNGIYMHPEVRLFKGPIPKDAEGNDKPVDMSGKFYGPSEMELHEPWDGITVGSMPTGGFDGRHICAYTRDQLEQIAEDYAHCAAVAKSVGMDGCIIHAGHGFLFSQFVSRRTNMRTDEFGGSMENRARFPVMCLERIRGAVGEDFIIELRFSGEEHISPLTERRFLDDTITIEETVEFFKELDKHLGLVDIAHISGGMHCVPVYNTRIISNSFFPPAHNVENAAKVKAAVKNMAVGVVGALGDPEVCEDIIASGKADFVIMARPLLIADTDLPVKAQRGEDEDINNCLRCSGCRNTGSCSVNPLGPFEPGSFYTLGKAVIPRRVAIVGGGIAGLKAAETAAKRGHSVVLFEKDKCLGGILRYTDNDKFKTEVRRFRDNMIKRVQKLGVDIRLGVEATPELVKAEEPFAVIAAVGGKFRALDIPGAGDANVLSSVECYTTPEKLSQHIAVIGGGLTGVECAVHLGSLGKEVTLISRSERLAKNIREGNINTQLLLLDEYGVTILRGCACRSIADGQLTAECADGSAVTIAADTIINATGLDSGTDLAESFRYCAPLFFPIGDCTGPSFIGKAVRDGYFAAMDI